MKKILIIIIAILLFVGMAYLGRSPNYQDLAIEYLKAQVHNPESVETIKFSELKVAPNPSYLDLIKLQNLERDTLKLKRNIALYKAKNTTDKDSIKLYLKLSRFYNTQDSILSDVINKTPKINPKLKLWKLWLTYKAKDENNILKVDTCTFIFDENLREVNYAEGIDL